MAVQLEPLKAAIACIEGNQNFVLQGGAGSGKTETLSQLITAIMSKRPDTKIACITHTNKAAAEIASRIGSGHYIGTIHAFLSKIFGQYKKNIHKHIWKLFQITEIHRLPDSDYPDIKTRNLKEHERFKKTYEAYAALKFTVKKIRIGRITGKKEYDLNPDFFNQDLNQCIAILNTEIQTEIAAKDYQIVEYNNSRFDNFERLTYGHDGLLKLAALLFEAYPILRKILIDKFDCILVDEFQDTDPEVVAMLLQLPKEKLTIGFFGDSMQAIYGQGIGNLDKFIASGTIFKIEKEDNYRCSEQVVDFINNLRYDGLVQSVALKSHLGTEEDIFNRQGSVSLYYSVYDEKPSSRSSQAEKDKYESSLDQLIAAAAFDIKSESKTLLLSNKAIASRAGYSKIYTIFSDRYTQPGEEIDKFLAKFQIFDLFEICNAYKNREFNFILTKLKQSGIVITKIRDKKNIADAVEKISDFRGNAISAVELAGELGLIDISETFKELTDRMHSTIIQISTDVNFQKFEKDYAADGHTFLKMSKKIAGLDEEFFNEQKRILIQRNFYIAVTSELFTLSEALEYCKYQDEQSSYLTMHKTKGTGINNVLVVLDEYFWNEYDFHSAFDPNEADIKKKEKNQRLIYVACSRAKHNLRCVRLVTTDEKYDLLNAFKGTTLIEVKIE